ncbi:MAG TPA: serine hydrolase domain-containing protein, partial [Rubrobacteraceae bacterium]|nr:serine hydrolase domain-containing protein [Rubrobacteraceae bacterium]
MPRKGLFGARAAVAAVACLLAVTVVLVDLVQADRAKATVPGGDSSTSKHKGHNKGGLVDPALEESLEAAFEKSFQDSGAPGAIAAVRTPDGTWVRSLGVANKASGQPMQPDMHHRIGSVTKTFTATLLLKAAARGQLSLDDTIDRYVEGIPNGDEITLRQMADMSSGIASYTENEQFQEDLFADPEAVWTPEELARIGIKDSPLFDPGKGWHYSNTNYVL